MTDLASLTDAPKAEPRARLDLTEADKIKLKALIDAGEPLPDDYRFRLFREPRETELIWPGKTDEVTNVILPFQTIEQIDEPRAEADEKLDLFAIDRATGRQQSGWSNKLIWGDNKLVLSSLKNGPMRREIEKAGGLKLVYIDPPFDVHADFSYEVEIGEDTLTKESSVIEEIAYRDTWGRGVDSFTSMLSERLKLINDLLAPDGSLYIQCDWRVTGLVRMMLDNIFGRSNHVNEIIWCFSQGAKSKKHFGRKHNTIHFYSKTSKVYIFNPHEVRIEMKSGKTSFGGKLETDTDGRQYRLVYGTKNKKGETKYYKYYLDEGKIPEDYWTDINSLQSDVAERILYPTQKPEALLERIIKASSNPGDLVADFFCGSGTTLAVAEKLGRKWIGCDLGRFAIHTARKRLIGVQRELKKEHKPWRSFEILNLGKYERQYFVGIDPSLPEDQRRALSLQKEEHYISLILQAYQAERSFSVPPFQGRKGNALIFVGAVDAPVTSGQIKLVIDAARRYRVTQVHVLGFEFEMSLTPRLQEDAREQGVNLAMRYIPKDVFDRRAVDKGQVSFHDVAYVEVKAHRVGREVRIELTRFGVAYRQGRTSEHSDTMKAGSTKVAIENGQVVKYVKDKANIVTKDVLTKKWTDWIDYWAIDFDYTRKEQVVEVAPDASGRMVERPAFTGGMIFENEWQSFRTKKDRTLELISAPHHYETKGTKWIGIKIIDIFGNDTTKVIKVVV